jgi:hypothetical protein
MPVGMCLFWIDGLLKCHFEGSDTQRSLQILKTRRERLRQLKDFEKEANILELQPIFNDCSDSPLPTIYASLRLQGGVKTPRPPLLECTPFSWRDCPYE